MDNSTYVPGNSHEIDESAVKPAAIAKQSQPKGDKVRAMLRARFGEEVYGSWFHQIEFDNVEGSLVRVSLPTKFLQTWIQAHYADGLLECCKAEFSAVERLDITVREFGAGNGRISEAAAAGNLRGKVPTAHEAPASGPRRVAVGPSPALFSRTSVNGFEGSPLDPKYTFESFEEGKANGFALAAAQQVAATVLDERRQYNPFYLHSAVGLGKTHLLHAIAWDVKRRSPKAQVLYLTAERFRYQFVEAVRSQDAMAFKDKFRAIDILLIDDLEFMQGEKTEQEFEHIINALLDGGRQVVVASARPPGQLDRLNDRMRSRMQRGLITEIGEFDEELRLKVLERRVQEKRLADPSFSLAPQVLKLLADRLTENGRELEGAVNRLYLTWQLMRQPITVELVETIIRDLVLGVEPRRIKVEDILRIVSRHFAVSKADILSDRRHRSVVRPRQIGMYLAKQLTSRSLPEIGRRFGNRDHTTVLHAIRKIDRELGDNPRLKDEIEELKRQLNR